MRQFCALLAVLIAPTLGSGQELQLRSEAIRLLERANRVSIAPALPNLERAVSFRVLDAGTASQEGTFTRVVVQGTGRRDEVTLGDYHVVNVWAGGHLATTRTKEVAPPEVASVMRLTPIRLVRFDHEDVINAIVDRQAGERTLRCIQFNTVAGQRSEDNELCVDSESGVLMSEKLGSELIENSDFFSFSGALIPARINYTYAGIPKLEISQTMTVLNDPTANVLAAPPDAQIRQFCTSFRRAFGENMPQPKPGNGTGETDLVLRGIIGKDGQVHDAVVQSSERPELDSEALSLIQQWTFTPSLCNGNPNATQASFTLHFLGR
jgi:TonB family protein